MASQSTDNHLQETQTLDSRPLEQSNQYTASPTRVAAQQSHASPTDTHEKAGPNLYSPLTTARGEYRLGMVAALSLLLGVLPFGIIYGALGIAAGLSPGAVLLMSATVFAGSAQFLALGLFAANALPAAIILATLIINLRHLLYGITLGQAYRQASRWLIIPAAFTTTDEVFVLTQVRAEQIARQAAAEPSQTQVDANALAEQADPARITPHLHWYALGTATILYFGWVGSAWIGIAGGQYIQDPTALGLEFALPASFIAFLVPQLRNRPKLICALFAGGGALLFQGLPLQSGLILAIILGVVAALVADRLQQMRNPDSRP